MPAIVWSTDVDLKITSSAGDAVGWRALGNGDVVGRSLLEYFATDDPALSKVSIGLEGEDDHPENDENASSG
jgi:hypothetical protein